MAEYIDIVSVKAAVASGDLKVEVNEIGNILLLDPRSKESVKIGEVPADVAPVRHGQWIEMKVRQQTSLVCSECGADSGSICGTSYCPNCGAKMDGEEDRE